MSKTNKQKRIPANQKTKEDNNDTGTDAGKQGNKHTDSNRKQ